MYKNIKSWISRLQTTTTVGFRKHFKGKNDKSTFVLVKRMKHASEKSLLKLVRETTNSIACLEKSSPPPEKNPGIVTVIQWNQWLSTRPYMDAEIYAAVRSHSLFMAVKDQRFLEKLMETIHGDINTRLVGLQYLGWAGTLDIFWNKKSLTRYLIS